MGWTQFNDLWNQLDYQRSGDLDEEEFKTFFGNLSEFEEEEGINGLSSLHGSEAMKQMSMCLFDLCDTLR